jgi:RNA-directed DNA polymerase
MTAAVQFRRQFSIRKLRLIYYDRIQKSGSVGIDRVHPESLDKDLSDELNIIIKKVDSGKYLFTPYKEKLISKGAESFPRAISIPSARDRITLRALCDFLALVFPEAVSEIPQVKIDALGKELSSGKYQEFVKIDIANFYPSIDHAKLLKALKLKIRKPEILALVEQAITTPTVPEQKGGKGSKPNLIGIPQGLAISNLLAEIFLAKLDKMMGDKHDIWYQRYVDDILILCPAGSSQIVADDICKSLEQLGLKPHRINQGDSKSKFGKIGEEFDFLGYYISGAKLSIRKQSIHKFESALARIFTSYLHKLSIISKPAEKQRALAICNWRLNLRITGCIFKKRRLGWVFYFSQITDTSRLRALDHTVSKLLQRFNLIGKIRVKRLLKTYYECRRKEKAAHHYIPNFDAMTTDERREILKILLGENKVNGLSDKKINRLFEMRISAAVRELEQDLANVS